MDVLQKRGEENVVYLANESEPYTGWAKRDVSQWHSSQVPRVHVENGKRTGRWVEWYENSQMWSEGHYENGELTGRWVKWHYNGQMGSEEHYENGKATGRWVMWDYNGQIIGGGTIR